MESLELLERAFVLHTRAYRETSLLVELLTLRSGRVSLLAKGIKRSPQTQFLLQPFTPLVAYWRGKGDLPVLSKVEADGQSISLKSVALFSALYLNELLMRVLHRHDPCEDIFELYHTALLGLAETPTDKKDTLSQQVVLRKFERQLLNKLGYGLSQQHEFNSNRFIEETAYYQFIPEQGFVPAERALSAVNQTSLFLGRQILDMAKDDYQDKETLRAAKQLMRLAFSRLLGNKPLKSRELFYS